MNVSVSPPGEHGRRVLSFEGGCNFRDIGGYRTSDGRTVRWRQVYRTGVLSYFTERDHALLKELEVRAICDLRRAEEREREPSRWPDDTADALSWHDGSGMPTIRSFAAERPNTAAGMFDAMLDLYRALPAWMGGRIRGMFECIAKDRIPLVIHCAAGKDRTGIAIAVLLRALGVPRETVIADYLLTNGSGDFEAFIRTRQQTQLGMTDIHHPLLAMPEDVRRVLFSADEAFLAAAFEQIEGPLGGFDAYLERTAGVTREARERAVEALLTR
jgi:protein-tyrosine phosphatase